MNVPKLRFPGFIGEWEERKLGSVSDVRDGTHDSPKYVSHGYPFVTSKNLLASGEIDFSTVNYISQIDYDNFNKRSIVEVGDILFGMIGTIGNAVIVKHAGFAIKNVALVKQSEHLLNSFLLTYLFSPILVKRITDSQVGGTQQFVSLSTIRNLIVTFPSLEEQEKIASFLSSVDNVIQLLTKKKTLLEDYKKGNMQKIFSQEIRFKDEDGNDFPDWEEKRLGDVSEIRRGASPRPITDPKWFSSESNIGWVRISDVTKSNKYLLKTEQYLSPEGVSKSVLVKTDNMIMSICATIGKPVYTKFEVCIHDGFVVFQKLQTNKDYLYYYLIHIQQKWYNYGQPGTQVNLNSEIVSNEVIPVPSLPEQQKIADFLSGIDRTIEIVNSQVEKTKEYKKGLLQQMFV